MPLPAHLIAASALVILLLGLLHLWFTFAGRRLHPRSDALRQAMETEHPVLTRGTTMWKAWVGFNASHSFGAMLYGLVYGYLAFAAPAVLLGSPFLLAVGAGLLVGYLVLGKRYWFSAPFRGILLAALLYAGALVQLAGVT